MIAHIYFCLRMLFGFLIGSKIFINKSWTTVTSSIDISVRNKKSQRLWAAILHGLPLSISLAIFVYIRRKYIHLNDAGLTCATFAVIWAWIGPVLIWRYEAATLPSFLQGCKKVLQKHPDAYERLVDIGKENVLSNWQHKIGCIVWIGLIVVLYIYGVQYFYFDPNTLRSIDFDIWWFAMLLAVAIYSYYTAIGFLLGYKTMRLTSELSQSPIDLDPYDSDGLGGMAFVGRFGTTTIWMFATGVLFIPILTYISLQIVASSQSSHQYGYVNMALIFVYLLSILIVFFIPVQFIHSAIVKHKALKMVETKAALVKLIDSLQFNDDLKKYPSYKIQRDLLNDLRAISEWPIQFKALSPILTAIAAIALAAIRLWLD